MKYNFDSETYYRPEDIAFYLHLDIDIIYDFIYSGQIEVVNFNDYDRILIPKSSIERFIKLNTVIY